jgi:hypothetical protein
MTARASQVPARPRFLCVLLLSGLLAAVAGCGDEAAGPTQSSATPVGEMKTGGDTGASTKGTELPKGVVGPKGSKAQPPG